MPQYYRDLVPWKMTHKGGTALACGTTSTFAPVPSGANCAVIYAEAGAIYWNVGGAAATTGSGGYAPQDTQRVILAVDNIGTGVPFIGSGTAAVAHVEWYQA